MKYIKGYLLVSVYSLLFSSCKKHEFEVSPLASFKIVNTVAGAPAARMNGTSRTVANNSSGDFVLHAGVPNIYVWPVGDSLNPFYNSNKGLPVKEKEIYSLFLGGSNNTREVILIKENLPLRLDSSAGVRIINLATNSPAIKVTLSTTSTVSEYGNIAFKQVTDFKSFPAYNVNSTYTFQFRNAATDALYSSITMSGASLASFVPRFRNVTLVFRGVVGGSPAPGITRVNHYPQ